MLHSVMLAARLHAAHRIFATLHIFAVCRFLPFDLLHRRTFAFCAFCTARLLVRAYLPRDTLLWRMVTTTRPRHARTRFYLLPLRGCTSLRSATCPRLILFGSGGLRRACLPFVGLNLTVVRSPFYDATFSRRVTARWFARKDALVTARSVASDNALVRTRSPRIFALLAAPFNLATCYGSRAYCLHTYRMHASRGSATLLRLVFTRRLWLVSRHVLACHLPGAYHHSYRWVWFPAFLRY